MFKIALLALLFGNGNSSSLSNLPGRRNAGSIASGRFVAPMTTTCRINIKVLSTQNATNWTYAGILTAQLISADETKSKFSADIHNGISSSYLSVFACPLESSPSISASKVDTIEAWIWSCFTDRTGANPSISSKNIMEGCIRCACSNNCTIVGLLREFVRWCKFYLDAFSGNHKRVQMIGSLNHIHI